MNIHKEKGRIYLVSDNNEQIGEVTYQQPNDNFIIIDHTLVEPKFEGHGYARILIKEAVDYAIENNLKVVPLCPYARKLFNEIKEYQEIEYKL
jgi:predicted GNAT family acetyltransferase